MTDNDEVTTSYVVTSLHVEVLDDDVWIDMPGFTKPEAERDQFNVGYAMLKELSTCRAVRRTVVQTTTREVLDD